MIKPILTIAVFLLLFSSSLSAQDSKRIDGIIIDSKTEEPLAFSHVGVLSTTLGTISNSRGEFSLLIPAEHQEKELTISYVGYENAVLPVDSLHISQEFKIKLNSVYTHLPELVIESNKKSIIEEAVAAIPKNHDQGSMKLRGFWRAQIQDQTQYLQLSETAFDIYRFGKKGKEEDALKILKGRVSRDTAALRRLSNFNAGVRPRGLFNSSFLLNSSILSKKALKRHEYKIVDVTTYNGRIVFAVDFDKKQSAKGNGFQGQILLDQETLAFVKISYHFSPSNEEPALLFDGNKLLGAIAGLSKSTWNKYQTEMSYQHIDGKWYLSYANFDARWTLVNPKKELEEPIDYYADFVVTDVSKESFIVPDKSEFANKKILEKQASHNEDDFWKEYNYMVPDKDFERIFKEIEEKNKAQAQEVDSAN